ncbi:MAG TPA: hypothetical protein VGJ37_19140 [Pyrinomonadaceae bacterium]|jgi:hypothetical protein
METSLQEVQVVVLEKFDVRVYSMHPSGRMRSGGAESEARSPSSVQKHSTNCLSLGVGLISR